jgi:hypothetical protein
LLDEREPARPAPEHSPAYRLRFRRAVSRAAGLGADRASDLERALPVGTG